MNFYIINNDLFRDELFAYAEQLQQDFNVGDSIYCKVCASPIGLRKWLPPLLVTISKYNTGDFITGTIGLLVSDNFRTAFLSSNLKGIVEFEPVEIYFNNKYVSSKKFFHALIMFSDIKVDLKRSGIEFDGDIGCEACQKGHRIINKMDRLIFEAFDVYEDIFHSKLLGDTVIVSERFKNFVEANNFTNLKLTPVEMYRPDWLKKLLEGAKIIWNISR